MTLAAVALAAPLTYVAALVVAWVLCGAGDDLPDPDPTTEDDA